MCVGVASWTSTVQSLSQQACAFSTSRCQVLTVSGVSYFFGLLSASRHLVFLMCQVLTVSGVSYFFGLLSASRHLVFLMSLMVGKYIPYPMGRAKRNPTYDTIININDCDKTRQNYRKLNSPDNVLSTLDRRVVRFCKLNPTYKELIADSRLLFPNQHLPRCRKIACRQRIEIHATCNRFTECVSTIPIRCMAALTIYPNGLMS